MSWGGPRESSRPASQSVLLGLDGAGGLVSGAGLLDDGRLDDGLLGGRLDDGLGSRCRGLGSRCRGLAGCAGRLGGGRLGRGVATGGVDGNLGGVTLEQLALPLGEGLGGG